MIAGPHHRAQPIEHEGFPTILVAGADGSLGNMAGRLELEGYLVLKALDGADALSVARVHSRRIQVLLVGVNVHGPTLAETLKPYRPEMRLLLVAGDPETTLAEVRQLLELPNS